MRGGPGWGLRPATLEREPFGAKRGRGVEAPPRAPLHHHPNPAPHDTSYTSSHYHKDKDHSAPAPYPH